MDSRNPRGRRGRLVAMAAAASDGRAPEPTAQSRRAEAVSAAAQAVISLAEAKRTIAFIEEARDAARRKQQEAEATITRVRREVQATISRLQTELEEAKLRARYRGGSQERTARHLLGVPAGASKNDIRAAWKRLAFTVHPDRCSGPEAKRLMQLANDALAWLKA